MKIRANNINIEVEDTGALPLRNNGQTRPVVLLIMGLGMQLVAWPPALVLALVNAGYRVVRHDNRDIGKSQHFDSLGNPNLVWTSLKHKLGLGITPPYSLQDMALDVQRFFGISHFGSPCKKHTTQGIAYQPAKQLNA